MAQAVSRDAHLACRTLVLRPCAPRSRTLHSIRASKPVGAEKGAIAEVTHSFGTSREWQRTVVASAFRATWQVGHATVRDTRTVAMGRGRTILRGITQTVGVSRRARVGRHGANGRIRRQLVALAGIRRAGSVVPRGPGQGGATRVGVGRGPFGLNRRTVHEPRAGSPAFSYASPLRQHAGSRTGTRGRTSSVPGVRRAPRADGIGFLVRRQNRGTVVVRRSRGSRGVLRVSFRIVGRIDRVGGRRIR